MKILVAEDDFASALVLEKALVKEGYEVVVCQNGAIAKERLEKEPCDLLLTDWMMPELDGLGLIRWARKEMNPVPAIAMLTVITNPEARAHAYLAGADEFIGKPYVLDDLLSAVETLLARKQQQKPEATGPIGEAVSPKLTGLAALVIGSGTGGPELLDQFFEKLPRTCWESAFCLVVQHGPDWLIYDLVSRLTEERDLKVELAAPGVEPEAGVVYLAHGEQHLMLESEPLRLELSSAAPENFMRPSIDVLFRSAAQAMGDHCIGIILSGIGCDGAVGAARLAGAGGQVVVQDPESAQADTMPRSVLDMDFPADSVPPEELADWVSRRLPGG